MISLILTNDFRLSQVTLLTTNMTKAKQKTKKIDKQKDDPENNQGAEGKIQNAETSELITPANTPAASNDSLQVPQTAQSKSPSKSWFQAEILSMIVSWTFWSFVERVACQNVDILICCGEFWSAVHIGNYVVLIDFVLELKHTDTVQNLVGIKYAFGDARRPSPESARLIEEIVHRQISNLVVQTADVTSLRGGKFMHTEDIKFLMRKDKEKLKKLNMFLSFKENKQKFVKQVSQDDDEILGSLAGVDMKIGNKRRRLSELGSYFDLKDDSTSFGDEAFDQKRDRLERAERLSRTLDTQQYLEFVECRQANFNKKAGKFKEWLDYTNLTDLKPNTPIMEVFSYLAYETVGQIVDLALLVKKDMERSDELSAVMPLLRENNASKINLPFISTPSLSTARSSTPTPPDTPTTPTSGGAPIFPSNVSGTTGSTSTPVTSSSAGTPSASSLSTSKSSKSKKRKTKLCSTSSTDLYSDCLRPHHIREAMRRYCSSIGPLAPFAPFMKTTPTYRTLCL